MLKQAESLKNKEKEVHTKTIIITKFNDNYDWVGPYCYRQNLLLLLSRQNYQFALDTGLVQLQI